MSRGGKNGPYMARDAVHSLSDVYRRDSIPVPTARATQAWA